MTWLLHTNAWSYSSPSVEFEVTARHAMHGKGSTQSTLRTTHACMVLLKPFSRVRGHRSPRNAWEGKHPIDIKERGFWPIVHWFTTGIFKVIPEAPSIILFWCQGGYCYSLKIATGSTRITDAAEVGADTHSSHIHTEFSTVSFCARTHTRTVSFLSL
jgi:hypothetical protein